MSTFLRNSFRVLHMGWVLARHDALFLMELAPDTPAPLKLLRAFSAPLAKTSFKKMRPGERLAIAMQKLGPSHIKMGQFLATRPDVIGTDVAMDLELLQDRLPPFDDAVARATVEEALGSSLDDLFEEFGPAVAAASIAQVHFAITKEKNGEPGRKVAVKVLRPGIEDALARDLEVFDWVAGIVTWLQPKTKRLRPFDVVQTLRASVELEMDLRLEAAAASELTENTKNDAFYRVPEIDWVRTERNVLTTERIEALSAHKVDELRDAGLDVKAAADHVIQSFLRQALRDGFFHADQHQGNLFIEPDGTLVPIDFGIMGRLDRETRRFLAEILFGFVTRNYKQVARVHYEAGYVPDIHPVETFAQALRSIGEPIFGRGADEVSMGRLLAQLFQVTETFHMQTQPQLILLQKTMVVVEGVARNLDPEHNIWEAAEPVLADWITTNMGPEAALRDAADGVQTLARNLPQIIDQVETIAERLSDPTGLKIAPESLEAFTGNSNQKLTFYLALGAALVSAGLLISQIL